MIKIFNRLRYPPNGWQVKIKQPEISSNKIALEMQTMIKFFICKIYGEALLCMCKQQQLTGHLANPYKEHQETQRQTKENTKSSRSIGLKEKTRS